MPSQQNTGKITTMTANKFFENVAVKMLMFCNSHTKKLGLDLPINASLTALF
jgi:hypothetical protein